MDLKTLFGKSGKSANPRVARERDAQQALTATALLDITEFQLFQLAWQRWYGEPVSEKKIERWFIPYMFDGIVPIWVRQFAQPPVTRGTAKFGRIVLVLLFAIVALLVWRAEIAATLLGNITGCYFPPCY